MADYIKLVQSQAELTSFKASNDFITPNVTVIYGDTIVDFNPYDPYNGHEYVDLDLPSGTLWATMNIGANSITDVGLYFQWGDTQGYTREQVGTDKQFNWANYKYGSSTSNMTKYNRPDGLRTLVPEDDTAHVNMGGNWMMPTKAQLEELWNNTDHSWVQNYKGSGVNGRLFTSRSDSSKTLFFPASGSCWDSNATYVGSYGYYWSSDVNSSALNYAWSMGFDSGGGGMSSGSRPSGFVVRGVSI